jgi:hypothetical protein
MKNTTEITADERIVNQQAYQKAWRLKNKERNKEKSKERYQLNKEKRKELYQLNKEKIKEKMKERYQLNKEKIDKKAKEYRIKRKAIGLTFTSSGSLCRKAWYKKNKESIKLKRKMKRYKVL